MLTGGILSDLEIRKAIREGRILIEPFRQSQLNPTSYDVTLGNKVSLYAGWYNYGSSQDGGDFKPSQSRSVFDPKNDNLSVHSFNINPKIGWVVVPGLSYLMHTAERVKTSAYVPIIDGKSTVGRLFISIHQTAGYGDPGFDGQFTLEVTSTYPVRLYPGMRIGQVRFHTIEGAVGKTYEKTGSYRGRKAEGPVPANFRRLFRGPK